jgi:hypothetical protein
VAQGDNLEERAAAFVKENGLAIDSGKFVESIRRLLEHRQLTAGRMRKDEL